MAAAGNLIEGGYARAGKSGTGDKKSDAQAELPWPARRNESTPRFRQIFELTCRPARRNKSIPRFRQTFGLIYELLKKWFVRKTNRLVLIHANFKSPTNLRSPVKFTTYGRFLSKEHVSVPTCRVLDPHVISLTLYSSKASCRDIFIYIIKN